MENQKTNSFKERSISYPSLTLEEAINKNNALIKNASKGPYLREDAARGMGYSALSGTAARAVAALVHYGLLERVGDKYNQTALSAKIRNPIGTEEEAKALEEALRSPKLFASLLDEFGGQEIPQQMDRILSRRGVNENVAKDVVRIFKASAEYGGLLKNGVLLKNANDTSIGISGAGGGQTGEQKTGIIKPKLAEKEEITERYVGGGEDWRLVIASKSSLSKEVKVKIHELVALLEQVEFDVR